MTQLGRGFRAALPRCCMPDQPYSQRAPMKWQIFGGFEYGPASFSFDGSQHTDPCVFVPALLAWTWSYSDVTHIPPFVVRISLQWTGRPGWVHTVNVIALPLGDQLTASYSLGPRGFPNRIYLGTFPEGFTPTVTATGLFHDSIYPSVAPLIYSLEP